MKQLKKIFFISFIFSCFTPIYSMERDKDLSEDTTELVFVLRQLDKELAPPSILFPPLPVEINITIFEQFVKSMLNTLFDRIGIVERKEVPSVYYGISLKEHLPAIGTQIVNFMRLNKEAKSIVDGYLTGTVKNVLNSRKPDKYFFSQHIIPPILVPGFRTYVQENGALKKGLLERFSEIMGSVIPKKMIDSDLAKLRKTFLFNFYNLGLLDDINPPEFYAKQWGGSLPEKFFIRLLERFKNNLNNEKKFKEALNADDWLWGPLFFNKPLVVKWLLDQGADPSITIFKLDYNIAKEKFREIQARLNTMKALLEKIQSEREQK